MNPSAIYSKTGKGVQEASGKTSFLSRGDRAILAAIDGRLTVQQLGAKFDRAADDKFIALLRKMDADGFIREVSPGTMQRGAANAPRSVPSKPPGGGGDLDFTQTFATPPRVERPSVPPAGRPSQAPADPMAAARHEAEMRARAQREAQARAEAAAREGQRERQEAEAKAKAAREAVMAAAAVGKTRAQIEAEQRAEEEAKVRAEAAARAAAEAAARAKADTEREAAAREVRERAVSAERTRFEAAERARREAEELRRRLEDERRAREEAERRAREEAERTRREAEERARREEEERRAREEAEALRQKLEEERRAREEAERRAEEERQRREQERLEEERRLREREEEERKEAEEHQRQIRLAREAEDRKRREADARKKKEEDARRWEAELARRSADEGYRQRAEQEDRERAAREAEEAAERAAAEKQAAEAADALAGSLAAELESFSQRQEEELRERHEQEQRERAAAEQRAREEQERGEREEEERRARKAEEKRRREEEEERARKEEEQRKHEEEMRQREEAIERERKAREQEARKRARGDLGPADADLGGDTSEGRRLSPEARKALRAREREVARARNRGDVASGKAAAAHRRKQPTGWGTTIVLFFIFTVLIGAGVANLVPLDKAEYEKAASEALGVPVKIGAARLRVLTGVEYRLENVDLGGGLLKAAEVRAVPQLASMVTGDKFYARVELHGATLQQQALGAALFGGMKLDEVRVGRVVADGLKLEGPLALPALDVDATLGAGGRLASIKLSGEGVTGLITPREAAVGFDIAMGSFIVPFVPQMTLTDFGAKGSADREGMTLSTFDGRLLDGTVVGSARLQWGADWSVQGQVEGRTMNAGMFAPLLVSEGRFDGKGRFTMSGSEPAKLHESLRLGGSFAVRKGQLASFDLSRALQSTSAQASGRTPFTDLEGEATYAAGALALRDLKLGAGLLRAAGTLDVDPKGALSGRVSAELRNLRGTYYIGGTLAAPQLRR
jgi:hypothetical protein